MRREVIIGNADRDHQQFWKPATLCPESTRIGANFGFRVEGVARRSESVILPQSCSSLPYPDPVKDPKNGTPKNPLVSPM